MTIRLLVISNNPLSDVQNNGKTILSLINGLEAWQVRQLYFNESKPTVFGYDYFKISDKDVIFGLFNHDRRGQKVVAQKRLEIRKTSRTSRILHSELFRYLREVIWNNNWNSSKLENWLKEFNPNTIFLVGGDCCFAYDIACSIAKEFQAKLSLFITDDYVFPRRDDSFIASIRREKINTSIKRTLEVCNNFFTISESMKNEYYKEFKRNSMVIHNLTESMKLDNVEPSNQDIVLIYAGSLYYGREDSLSVLAKTIQKYNKLHIKKAKLLIYCNSKPESRVLSKICIENASEYGGSLSKEELKIALNKSNILVFVESYDPKQIDKVKLSLSTKIPEYLSVGKAILALGPSEIGSMQYLENVAECINDPKDMENKVFMILDSETYRNNLGKRALRKFDCIYRGRDYHKQFLKCLIR